MSRNQVWTKRLCQTGLAVFMAASPFTAAPFGGPTVANTAWAAESTAKRLTQDEALAKAKQWVQVPEGYKVSNTELVDWRDGNASWIFIWEPKEGRGNGIRVEVDAVNGTLFGFRQYGDGLTPPTGARPVDEKAAEQAAREFLRQVAPEEVDELSQPNQYKREPARELDQHHFVFTRMVGEVPFLENGLEVTVDKWGRVVGYSREWWTGKLPDAKPSITREEAEPKLKQALKPSVVFADLDRWISFTSSPILGHRPVYRYESHDAYALDAVTGDVLTRKGEKATERSPIQPLGSTTRTPSDPEVRITKEEAQTIADQLAKRIDGSYRSEGSGGGGMSSGPDGVTRHWSFDYRPEGSTDPEAGIELSINDRGELERYETLSHRRAMFEEKPTESPVSYAKAEEAAVVFMKTLLSDRLGELYLLPLMETDKELRTKQAKQIGRYEISFGWMKNGIPLENGEAEVTVDAATGVVIGYHNFDRDNFLARLKAPEKLIDPKTAVETETKQKQLQLTYFLPDVVWDAQNKPLPREVRLVYRYVGADGVVDAATGEWLDRYALVQKYLPRDIVGHPQEEALRYAVERSLIAVKDGRVEPDKPLTRGELAFMAARKAYDLPIYNTYRRSLFDDEEPQQPHRLEDVPTSHPQYQSIQQVIAMGLMSPAGSRFEPDRPVTRLEAAEVAAKLLGYGRLLDKPDAFAARFADVSKPQAPAAVMAHSLDLVQAVKPGRFEPNGTFTRAEAARMFMLLDQMAGEH